MTGDVELGILFNIINKRTVYTTKQRVLCRKINGGQTTLEKNIFHWFLLKKSLNSLRCSSRRCCCSSSKTADCLFKDAKFWIKLGNGHTSCGVICWGSRRRKAVISRRRTSFSEVMFRMRLVMPS